MLATCVRAFSIFALVFLLGGKGVAAFVAPPLININALVHQGRSGTSRTRASSTLIMRDASMVRDFAVGDVIRVKSGIKLDGLDWSGMVGTVTDTWVKCEVDPHCCCAEQATDGPIRVDFPVTDSTKGKRQYFAEDEIEKIKAAATSGFSKMAA